ncbi:MAG: hypothetical protein CBD74_07150 [Saprospirales bacterium TMED214]|nr:MAG: hypothetical protein CBD74_07150 [Saprospirales bacterium TMED214]
MTSSKDTSPDVISHYPGEVAVPAGKQCNTADSHPYQMPNLCLRTHGRKHNSQQPYSEEQQSAQDTYSIKPKWIASIPTPF